MMSILIEMEKPPLRQDSSGALRVGSSRVLLELVIRAFQDGATAEAIVQSYPTTTLADVYGVIAYYLRHQGKVEDYLVEREEHAQILENKITTRQKDISHLHNRLLERRNR